MVPALSLLGILIIASCSGGAEQRTPDASPPPDSGAPGVDAPDANTETETGTPLKPAGEYCGADTQCASGHCSADMVCCNTACADACYTCSAAGSLGTCVPADVGTNPRSLCQDMGAESCKQSGQCDGAGACALYAAGTVCAQPGCRDSTLTSAGRCDGTGTCSGAGGQSCAPFKCGANGQCRTTCSADTDCVTPNSCVQGSCGKKPLGATCGDNGECNSSICAQGVCCSTTCSGSCKSCALSGSAGTCTNVPAGQDPLMQCTDGGAMTCGLDGACNGAGACRSYAAGTVCGMDSCAVGTATLAGRCGSGTGAGMCQVGTTQSCSPYVCGTTSCLTRCATNADCATGFVCNGTICTRKPNGTACTAGSECTSNQCYQGVCCNVACGDVCVSCNLAGTSGTCTTIAAGMPPVLTSQCPTSLASTCGNDGACDGAGACRQHSAGTVCAAATCTGSTLTSSRTCDGAGLCRPATSSSCDPYQCGTNTACRVDCATSADCLSPNSCMAMSCGKKPNGATCTMGSECNSTFCAQGVCCATACTGTCKSCSVTGSVGNCTNVPSGSVPTPATQCTDAGPTSCGNDGTCNGNGVCRNYVSGTACAGATCTGSTFTPPRLCTGTGTCAAGTASSCGPYLCDTTAKICKMTCGSDADCLAPNVCNAGTCSKKPLGTTCTGATECASGFCQQGVCCATACTGTCLSCALTGSSGNCTNVPVGADPLNQCEATLAATCGTDGACDGMGDCRRHANGTQCVAATCSGSALVPARTCDGAGVCRTVTNMLCDPFGCNPTATPVACRTSCSGNSDCAAPNVCSANSCGNKPNGAACTADGECNSRTCAQGVCCSTVCTGTCRSCAISTSMGTCASVPAGQDPLNQCPATAASTCDEDGTCNGSGACRLHASGTECVAASCTGSTLTARATCDGSGTCGTPATSSCTPYNCGTGACKTGCTTSADCINTNFICTGTTCTPALNLQVRLKMATLGTTQDIRAHIQITNNSVAGMAAVPLSQLTVRYWYTVDQTGTPVQVANCDYTALPGGAGSIVTGPFAAVSPARTKANYYFQFGFGTGAGSLNAGGATTGDIQMRWHKEPYANYDQSNDYSYNGSASFVPSTNVTVYRNGTLIYGTEPI